MGEALVAGLDLRVIGGERNVTVTATVVGCVCNADNWLDDGATWMICRVFIATKYRRQGYGTRMLSMLFEELRKRPKARLVTVTPGGYDVPSEQQFAFYKSCGFVDDPDPKMGGQLIYPLR